MSESTTGTKTDTIPGLGASDLAAAHAEIASLRGELAEARQTIDAAERARIIDRELAAAGAVDHEVASLLTEMSVRVMDKPDVALAVRDLRRRKPFLFRRDGVSAPAGASAMSASPRASAPSSSQDAAEEARTTGDRRALLRYLRARRDSSES